VKRKADPMEGAASCRQCVHFHERTESRDDAEWGECWRDPPEMGFEADEADNPMSVPVVRWLFLPYVCGSIKPRQ
jgi:hypothetical protein